MTRKVYSEDGLTPYQQGFVKEMVRKSTIETVAINAQVRQLLAEHREVRIAIYVTDRKDFHARVTFRVKGTGPREVETDVSEVEIFGSEDEASFQARIQAIEEGHKDAMPDPECDCPFCLSFRKSQDEILEEFRKLFNKGN